MPFAEVEIVEPPKPAGAGSVKIMMRGKARRTSLTLTAKVVADPGWEVGERVKMLVGSGDDAGTLRFVKAAAGAKGVAHLRQNRAPGVGKKASGSVYYVLPLGFVAFTPKGAESMKAEGCEHDILGGDTLEVELPSSWQSRPPEVVTGVIGSPINHATGARKDAIAAARQAVPAEIKTMALRR